ncbi:MAG: hypothetical protein PHE88_12315 [Elusimicrobia bacterium]|nr:hypothetical protein [Elusimicrobiota bacterium]
MSKVLICQEVTSESLFKWVGIVKTIFLVYHQLTISGKEKTILALHFPVEKVFREMSIYFYNHKIKKALCEFSIEERNIEVTLKDYCSWYYFENQDDNFSFDHKKDRSIFAKQIKEGGEDEQKKSESE